jgi:hypothetical protein
MREKHDEQERAAFERAVQGLRDSTSAVSGLPKSKLQSMAQDVISAWLAGRSQVMLMEAPETVIGGSLLKETPGRVPVLEPYIEKALPALGNLDLPWDKPIAEWEKPEVVRLLSAGMAQALLFEKHTLDQIPFPDNPAGKIAA